MGEGLNWRLLKAVNDSYYLKLQDKMMKHTEILMIISLHWPESMTTKERFLPLSARVEE